MQKKHYLFLYDVHSDRTSRQVRRKVKEFAIFGSSSCYMFWMTAAQYKTFCDWVSASFQKGDTASLYEVQQVDKAFQFGIPQDVAESVFFVI
jgi:hypothetical protein